MLVQQQGRGVREVHAAVQQQRVALQRAATGRRCGLFDKTIEALRVEARQVQYSAAQCSALQRSAVLCSAAQVVEWQGSEVRSRVRGLRAQASKPAAVVYVLSRCSGNIT